MSTHIRSEHQHEYLRFFRIKLLSSSPEQVQKLIQGMENEVNDIYQSSIQFSWYMRGGVSFVDIMNMDNRQRKMISELVKDNLETTKKSQMPFF